MNASRADDALRLLSERAAEREHVLPQFSPTRHVEPDHAVDAESPILNSFYQTGGNDSIMRMTNLSQLNCADCTRLSTIISHLPGIPGVGRGLSSSHWMYCS